MSALIFVALAVAWAAYLVPKALRHHEDVAHSRSVERFSDTMRVLARREPVDARNARLVVTPGRPAAGATSAPAPAVEVAPEPVAEPTAAETRSRREAANRAARRRRRVLLTLLVANLAVAGLAAFAVHSWWYVAIPAGLLVAWLVACRVMVRHERGISRRRHPVRAAARAVAAVVPGAGDTGSQPAVGEDVDATQDVPVVGGIEVTAEARVDPALWDPVPVTLPTYVTKPAATRTVRTIDLDSTGVWTSGRTEADSQIAREAEQAEREERAARSDDEVRRATGS